MGRQIHGSLPKLTAADKKKRVERNERRGRKPIPRKWNATKNCFEYVINEGQA